MAGLLTAYLFETVSLVQGPFGEVLHLGCIALMLASVAAMSRGLWGKPSKTGRGAKHLPVWHAWLNTSTRWLSLGTFVWFGRNVSVSIMNAGISTVFMKLSFVRAVRRFFWNVAAAEEAEKDVVEAEPEGKSLARRSMRV